MKSLSRMLKVGLSVLCLPFFLSSSALSHAEGVSKKVFVKIPSNSSLKYLYSDLEFSGPEDITQSGCDALNLDFIKKFPGETKQCLSISYKMTEYKTYAVLIKGVARDNKALPNLLVYNHGHGGLPAETEGFAYKLVADALATGNDVLLVSMPFVGVDIQRQPIMVKTWDGDTKYDPKDLEGTPAAWHGVFEMFDTGKSHYMRFFMDSAVVNVLNMKEHYNQINFLGLSGGATTGLYACNVLKDILSNCMLAAGVMPIKYRFIKNNFGDAEQVSASFFRKNKVIDLVREISESKTKLHLIYNDKDACCYTEASATAFRKDLSDANITGVDYVIRKSNNHDYDPDAVLSLINSK